MSDHNLPVTNTVGYSQGSTSQNLLNTVDVTGALPHDEEVLYSTYGYNEPHNAQNLTGSVVPFTHNQALTSTETVTPMVGLIPELQTMTAWFGNQASEPIVMQDFHTSGQQNNTRMLKQDHPSNFLDQTVACIRAFNANSDPDDEQISKLAAGAGLTVTEMTCWFGLVPKIRQCVQTKASASFARVPPSPSESRSFTSPDAGASTGQSDHFSPSGIPRSARSQSQVQIQALPSPWRLDPRNSQIYSPPASRKRRLPSKNVSDTISRSVSVTSKRSKLDVSEKLYPCLDCRQYYPTSGWYEHVVRVHFPEIVWTCGCKENKDADMQKLWPRWDNFLKHLVERHGFRRSPAEDTSMKSRGIQVVGCYHHICGFCEKQLQTRQNSLDHIKEHLDSGFQLENWTHLCSSDHDLRSHILADSSYYPDNGNKFNYGPGDDENGGDGYGAYDSHHQEIQKSAYTPANAGSAKGWAGNSGGSQPPSDHQSGRSNHVDCDTPETPISSDLDGTMLPFKSLRELGHGGYGIVDEVVSSSSKETYARKTIRSRQVSHATKTYIAQLRNELWILKQLNHPHLIKLVGYYTTHTSLYIIMLPVADVNLADYISRFTSSTSCQRNLFMRWMSCLASAVEYLHDKKIQHRDIKPQNVLVKGQEVFLTDLGNAKLLLDPDDVSAGKMIITPMYCAPETISEGLQDCKADIFSLGCVFTEMCTGYFGHLFEEIDTTVDFHSKPYHLRVGETQKFLKDIKDLHNGILTVELTLLFTTICQMLEIEPTERPEAKGLQFSFPEYSRCRCSYSQPASTGVTPSDNLGLLSAPGSSGLENLSFSALRGNNPKSPTTNNYSSETAPMTQDFMKPTVASNSSHKIEYPGITKISPLESNSTRLLSPLTHTQVFISQQRSARQCQPESDKRKESRQQDRRPHSPLIAPEKTSYNLKDLLSTSTSFQPSAPSPKITTSSKTLSKSVAAHVVDARKCPKGKDSTAIELKLGSVIGVDASVSQGSSQKCDLGACNGTTTSSRNDSYDSTLMMAIQQTLQPSYKLQQNLSHDQTNIIEHLSGSPAPNRSNSARKRTQSTSIPLIFSPKEQDIIIQDDLMPHNPSSDISGVGKRPFSPLGQFGDDSYTSTQQHEQISLPNLNSPILLSHSYESQEKMLQIFSGEQNKGFFTGEELWSSSSDLRSKSAEKSQLLINTQDTIVPGAMPYFSQVSESTRMLKPGLGSMSHIVPRPFNAVYWEPQIVDYQHSERNKSEYRTIVPGKLGGLHRRPFQDIQTRQQTARTRMTAACIRCRMQRIRCEPDPGDPQGVCYTCQKVSSLKIFKLPCLRYKITDITLFVPDQASALQWTKRWPNKKIKDISTWASDETRIIRTTECFSLVSLDFEVRQFIPEVGDVLDRCWSNPIGIRKSFTCPCYALASIGAAQSACIEQIKCIRGESLISWFSNKDELLIKTYTAAIEAANNPNILYQESELLKMILQLWISIRITMSQIFISGEDTLGMRPECDKTSPFYGKIPIPPVMEAQIKLILTQNMQIPLSKKILDLLQTLIMKNSPKTWFTVYLCNFILLHNYAVIINYEISYKKKYGLRGRSTLPDILQRCQGGANVLLAYWHYINKGYQPFSPETDFVRVAKLNPSQREFVQQTSHYVQSKANDWQLRREGHDDGFDFTFVSQLYEKYWRPKM